MCYARKCCYFIKLDKGCLLVAVISLIFSIVMAVSSTIYLSIIMSHPAQDTSLLNFNRTQLENPSTREHLFTLKLTLPTLEIILSALITVGLLKALASVMLVIGISQKKPGLVLFYFGFGIFFTIICMLCGLLLLLHQHWAVALTIFIVSLLYIHFLVVVHTVYDQLQKARMTSYESEQRLVDEIFYEDLDLPPTE